MTNDEYKIMLDAADSVYSNGLLSVPDGYYLLDYPLKDHNNNGFKAVIFKNDLTNEYIISFAGTEDLQDAHADIKLGWDQWKGEVRNDVIKFINDIVSDHNATKIHFTGHSLGGALAQYALYEYISTIRTADDPTKALPVPVDITTFNALGGLDGLTQYLPDTNKYREGIVSDIDGAHFYVKGDLVSRLGGEHIGGSTYMLPPSGKDNLNLIDSHKIKAVQTIVNLDEFINVTQTKPLYLDISDLQQLSGELSTFLSFDSGVDNFEASQRIKAVVLGILGLYISLPVTPEGELDSVLSAVFNNLKEASHSGAAQNTFAILEITPFETLLGWVSEIPHADKLVSAAFLSSLVAVAIDEAFDVAVTALDLPPVWRDRMPDKLITELMSDVNVFSIIFPPARGVATAVDIIELLVSLEDGTLPQLSAETFEIQEGQSDVMTLTLSETQDRDLAVLVKVHDSERLVLTGDDITIIDSTLGKYRVTFPAGTTEIDINVQHLMYGDITDSDGEIDFYLVPLNEINGALNNANQSTVTLTLTEYEITQTPEGLTPDADYYEVGPEQPAVYVQGGDGNDMIFGTHSSGDILHGGDGNDWIFGAGGQDSVLGQAGDDHITGLTSGSVASGGEGNDLLSGLFGEGLEIAPYEGSGISESVFWTDFNQAFPLHRGSLSINEDGYLFNGQVSSP